MADRKWPALDLRFSPGPGAGSLQDFLYAELDAFEPVAIQEHESGDAWRVFFRTRTQRNNARAALRAEFGNALLDLSPVDVDDEDWARRSQSGLTSVRVGRIVVAPPWDVTEMAPAPIEGLQRPAASVGPSAETRIRNAERGAASADIVIVIEPSTGFGTGHHETTRLCLALLQETDVAGRRAIDLGTGSGVLAIAAAKLGASAVLAVDNDPDALANAEANVARNAVHVVELREADAAAMEVAPADIVMANLTAAALQGWGPALGCLVAPGGVLIASGFSPGELPDVAAALQLRIVRRREERGWTGAILQRHVDTGAG